MSHLKFREKLNVLFVANGESVAGKGFDGSVDGKGEYYQYDTIGLPGKREEYGFQFQPDGSVDIENFSTGAKNNFKHFRGVLFGGYSIFTGFWYGSRGAFVV